MRRVPAQSCGVHESMAACLTTPLLCAFARGQDRAEGHVAGALHVGTQAVWLRDEGPGGAVDQARRRGHRAAPAV